MQMNADVLVVGAGPAGSATAYLLARDGLDVLLVDRHEFPREKPCGDCLTPRSLAALGRLSLLRQIEGSACRRHRGARLYAPGGRVTAVDYGPEAGVPRHGLVVSRLILDEALRGHAEEAGARFVSGFRAIGPLTERGRVVGVGGERTGRPMAIRASLVVVATGANTTFLRAMGFLAPGLPAAVALRGYYEGVEGIDDYIELYLNAGPPLGYGWIFPGAGGLANVGVGFYVAGGESTRADLPAMLRDFTQKGSAARKLRCARRIGRARGGLLRISFPMTPVYGHGVLLVGEAAGLVDPLVGEGVSAALESAEIAAQVSGEALSRGDTSAAFLAEYGRLALKRFSGPFASMRHFRERYSRPLPLEALVLLMRLGYRPGFWPYR